jgi:hypothetical protein
MRGTKLQLCVLPGRLGIVFSRKGFAMRFDRACLMPNPGWRVRRRWAAYGHVLTVRARVAA